MEFEQKGEDRAKHGGRLLARLSNDLSLGSGSRLRAARPSRKPATPPGEISASLMRKSAGAAIKPLCAEAVLSFSWTQLIEPIRLDDPLKRAFHENQRLQGNWSVRQLQRQIGSLLYARTGLSTDKAAVIKRARRQEPQETIEDLIRDPYVLEFTGLAGRPEYTESRNFYLNWWKQNVTSPDEQPPVGILLCSDREHAKVEFATAGMDNKLFVSRYLVVLPSEEQLRRFLETDRARTEALIEQGRSTPRRGRRPGKSRP